MCCRYVAAPSSGFFTSAQDAQSRLAVLAALDLEYALLGELTATGVPPQMAYALRVLLYIRHERRCPPNPHATAKTRACARVAPTALTHACCMSF
jgi:hypothetical protein